MVGLYLFSLAILAAYCLTVYYFTSDGILGCVISIAIVSSDVIIFLIIRLEGTDIPVSPTSTSIFAMLIRVTMFASSEDYWYIGYSVIYLTLMLYVSGLVVDKHYPNFDKIPSLEVTSVNLMMTP